MTASTPATNMMLPNITQMSPERIPDTRKATPLSRKTIHPVSSSRPN